MNVDAELIVLPYAARGDSHLLDRLIAELDSDRWTEFRAAVAFGRRTASIPDLMHALEEFAARGHIVSMTFCARRFAGGTYATDYEVIADLVEIFDDHANAKVYLYGQEEITFHPKLYVFANEAESDALMIVGSSNWSESGLVRNIEANAALMLDLRDAECRETYEQVMEYFDKYWTG